jgi:DNA-binding IclR family transcriptional regulator
MRPDRAELTTLHWVVLGLVRGWQFSPPERLANQIGIDVEAVEQLCQDLERLGWLQRVDLQ